MVDSSGSIKKSGPCIINPFDPKKIKTDTTMVIIGRRGSGKSTVVRWICYYLKKKIRFPLVVCATEDSHNDYKGIVPGSCIYTKYNPDILKELIKQQKMLTILDKKKDPRYHGKVIKALVLMDDVLSDVKAMKKDNSFSQCFFEGRHDNITFLITASPF